MAAVAEREDDARRRRLDGVEAPRPHLVRLHLEKRREIGAQLQGELDLGRLVGEVADRDVLAHAVTDVAVAHDEQRRVRKRERRPHTADEGLRERVRGDERQRLGRNPIDDEAKTRAETGVAHEEALDPARLDVAVGRRDAERRAREQRRRAARLASGGARPVVPARHDVSAPCPLPRSAAGRARRDRRPSAPRRSGPRRPGDRRRDRARRPVPARRGARARRHRSAR